MLRSLRHNLRAQSPGHRTIDYLKERGVESGSARRFSLKGRERAVVSQTSNGNVSKTTLRELPRQGGGSAWKFFDRARKYHLDLNMFHRLYMSEIHILFGRCRPFGITGLLVVSYVLVLR